MLLAIDIGNTQTVIGLFSSPGDDLDDGVAAGDLTTASSPAETDLVDHWRIATNAERTSDEHALVVQEFLGFHGFSFDDDVDGIAISSVVPRSTAAFRQMTEKYFGFRPVVIEPGVKTGMPILTENPREVGADRIANAVAALDLFGGPAIVIDFGTAITYDALSAKGEYLGGLIAPGVEISLDALYTRAAALRRVELVEPRNIIGRTTVESIQAGAIFGFAGQVDGICRRLIDEMGAPSIVATGGLAELIAPYTSSIQRVEPWLTLHGLRLVFARNA
ncbi:MAG: type III pantothenate kinase [Acidimicrobiia bacterium]|nr:type III pantothenate kinase [Acidimicrobiia bacterium]